MPLLNDSTPFREQNLRRNEYSKNNEYGPSHPNALSNGDEKGKGEYNGQIGNATDIAMRARLTGMNKYNRNNEYVSVDEKPL